MAQIAAGTAETDLGLRVAVIPTQAQVQGLAALSVHEPGRGFDSDVLEFAVRGRRLPPEPFGGTSDFWAALEDIPYSDVVFRYSPD